MLSFLQSASGLTLILASAGLPGAYTLAADSTVQPQGKEKTFKTQVLEAGAALLQSDSPLEPMNIYLDGFHAAKEDPSHQMEAHHFCRQVNEDFAQCVLFDDNTRQANLIGIEYIISETLFDSLPLKEKKYWHPHNFEILSGQLIAPGIPEMAEKELMKGKMNSYGKTWHVWNSAPFGKTGDKLPLGVPVLEWSFNYDGEALPGLIEQRDQKQGASTGDKRRERAGLTPLAKPQMGVNALKGKFPRPTTPLPGVMDKKAEEMK
ncbi:MAG: OBAP family protein [Methylobacter sp.]|nr:OBAP family protein [Methylobacter sp.]